MRLCRPGVVAPAVVHDESLGVRLQDDRSVRRKTDEHCWSPEALISAVPESRLHPVDCSTSSTTGRGGRTPCHDRRRARRTRHRGRDAASPSRIADAHAAVARFGVDRALCLRVGRDGDLHVAVVARCVDLVVVISQRDLDGDVAIVGWSAACMPSLATAPLQGCPRTGPETCPRTRSRPAYERPVRPPAVSLLTGRASRRPW